MSMCELFDLILSNCSRLISGVPEEGRSADGCFAMFDR